MDCPTGYVCYTSNSISIKPPDDWTLAATVMIVVAICLLIVFIVDRIAAYKERK